MLSVASVGREHRKDNSIRQWSQLSRWPEGMKTHKQLRTENSQFLQHIDGNTSFLFYKFRIQLLPYFDLCNLILTTNELQLRADCTTQQHLRSLEWGHNRSHCVVFCQESFCPLSVRSSFLDMQFPPPPTHHRLIYGLPQFECSSVTTGT